MPLWGFGAGLRFDIPIRSRGGVGAGWTAELRWIRTVRDLRVVWAASFGWAGCRGDDCPPLDFVYDGDTTSILGIFGHLGLSVGAAARFAMGSYQLELVGGAESSLAALAAPDDYVGPRIATRIGPFVAARITRPRRGPPAGFAPAFPSLANGVEVRVSRPSTMGRPPVGADWLLSLGWTVDAAW